MPKRFLIVTAFLVATACSGDDEQASTPATMDSGSSVAATGRATRTIAA